MKINTEVTDDGVLIQFDPEIESEIAEFREEKQKEYNDRMRYVPLTLWADFKYKNDDKYKEYEKYNSNPKDAVDEVREILKKINEIRNPDISQEIYDENNTFYLLNHQIPSCVCAVLVEHYIDKLNDEDKEFCKDVIIDKVITCVQSNYFYQVGDGMEEAITSLPKLMKLYPNEKQRIKVLLLLILFKDESVGFNVFSMIAINKMWEKEFDDANSLLLGYLILKQKYDKLKSTIRKENSKNGVLQYDLGELLSRFLSENDMNLNKMVNNEFSISDVGIIEELDLLILSNALKMMPIKLERKDHMEIAYQIISVFATELMQDRDYDKVNYTVRNEFFKKYACIVLNSESGEVTNLIQPFIDKFNPTEPMAEMFQQFIYAEDRIMSYDNFWNVWNNFKDSIIKVTNRKSNSWYVDKIIKNYLFAEIQWNDSIKEWHSFKAINMRLIKSISENIGNHPSVLYSISKLLNNIGRSFISEGIILISNMLSRHSEYSSIKLEENTNYYLENLLRKYVYEKRDTIKKNKQLKKKTLVVLNFIIEKGSAVGYILRETII
ncbi:hypothetical protein [Clostridium sp.]|uniref:hypothetical protein n=1 Tax=Clostridium sp. TaxID=1506 RepID=UPI0039908E47